MRSENLPHNSIYACLAPDLTGSRAFLAAVIWLLTFNFSAAIAFSAPADRSAGEKYDNKKRGFRLQVLAGWRHSKESGLVALETNDGLIAFSVDNGPFEKMTPEQFLMMHRVVHGPGSTLPMILQEKALVSGLPATKFTYATKEEGEPIRVWQIYVFSRSEEWHLYVSGPDELLRSPGNQRYREVQDLISSFQFLEPTLSRVRKGLWTATQAAEAGSSAPEFSGNTSRSASAAADNAKILIYAVIFGIMGGLVILSFYTTRRKHKRLLQPLQDVVGAAADELEGSYLSEENWLKGHFLGREVVFSIEQASEGKPSEFRVMVACQSPFIFGVRRKGASLVGQRITTGDPDVDKGFEISDLIGGTAKSLFGKILSMPSLAEGALDQNRKHIVAWLLDPEVKNTVRSLFLNRGIDSLIPGPFESDESRRTGSRIKATYYSYRKQNLDPNAVRAVLEEMSFLAQSLESRRAALAT